MRLPPPALAELLDTVTVEGLAHLDGLQQERGVLLLSVHYSLSTSLLWLWLARATAQGRFRHLATLFRSGPVGGYADLWRRFGELETVGHPSSTLEELFLRVVEESKARPGRRYLPPTEEPAAEVAKK